MVSIRHCSSKLSLIVANSSPNSYVCGLKISAGYEHFDKPGSKCAKFDKQGIDLVHEEEVNEAQKVALAKIQAERPEFENDDLAIRVSEAVRNEDNSRRERAAQNNPYAMHIRRLQQPVQHLAGRPDFDFGAEFGLNVNPRMQHFVFKEPFHAGPFQAGPLQGPYPEPYQAPLLGFHQHPYLGPHPYQAAMEPRDTFPGPHPAPYPGQRLHQPAIEHPEEAPRFGYDLGAYGGLRHAAIPQVNAYDGINARDQRVFAFKRVALEQAQAQRLAQVEAQAQARTQTQAQAHVPQRVARHDQHQARIHTEGQLVGQRQAQDQHQLLDQDKIQDQAPPKYRLRDEYLDHHHAHAEMAPNEDPGVPRWLARTRARSAIPKSILQR